MLLPLSFWVQGSGHHDLRRGAIRAPSISGELRAAAASRTRVDVGELSAIIDLTDERKCR
jgi:hypothetical protein